jgi:hypothetical protein
MTSYKKLACFLSTMILLSLPMFGQYVGTPQPGMYDGTTTYCATSNCWTTVAGTMQTVSEASDGTLMGTNAGNIYQWDPVNLDWVGFYTTGLGGSVVKVAAQNTNNKFAITTESSNNVYYYDPIHSTWKHLAGNGECYDIGVAGNGDMWCIGGLVNSNNVYHYVSGAWAAPAAKGILGNISVAGDGHFSLVYGVNSSHVLFAWTGSSWNNATGLAFTPSAVVGAVGGSSDGSIVVLDTSGGIHISEEGGGTWHHVAGTLSYVTDPSLLNLVAVNSAGAIFHYNGLMPAINNNTSGTYTCPGCTGSSVNHTVTAKATFPHGIAGGQGMQVALWSTNFNINAVQDYSPSCDVIFTFGNPECNVALTNTADCPIAGYLPVSQGQTNPGQELIIVHTKIEYEATTGRSYQFPLSEQTVYQYLTTDDCSEGTNIHVRDMWDTEPGPYWDVITFLIGYVDSTSGIGYWHWIWSIGGQSLDGSPILCQSAPGAGVIITGTPYVDPTIGSI